MTPNEESEGRTGTNAPPEEMEYPKESYAWYVVGILMVVYIFSFIDRQILALLVGPIRTDLQISDTQMSLLMGFSFALFYTIFGIPLGRLADSKSRRTIIAIGLGVWSLMSAGCGVAKNYTQLLIMRIGVGIGEATLSPSAYSLITDYFRPKRLATAISVYGAGIYIGSGMAFLLGGAVVGFASGQDVYQFPVIGDVRPWQLVFFAIGIPGLLFTVMLYTIREPIRRGIAGSKVAGSIPMGEVVSYIVANWKTFICHTVGFSMLSFIGYGSASWVPSFYIRNHDWDPGRTGMLYGIAVMLFGTAGIIFGGQLADRLADKGYKDAKMRTGLIAAVAHIPFGILFVIVPNPWVAYIIMMPASFLLAMPFGVAPAAIQEMMPNQMRGQASAIYLFVVNLIGLGLGPTGVALCTEYLFNPDTSFGPTAIKAITPFMNLAGRTVDDNMVWAALLVTSTLAGVIASVLLYLGLGNFRKSIKHRDDWHEAAAKAPVVPE